MAVYPTVIENANAGVGTTGQPLSNPNHITQHNKECDIIDALQAKVGIDASADNTTIDYKLKNAASVNPGHKHSVAALTATGTPDATTVLYGNNTWAAPPAVVDASTSTKGITKITPAPASATEPIALGSNFATTSTTPLDNSTNKVVDAADVAENTNSKIVRRKSDGNITVPASPASATDAVSLGYLGGFKYDGKLSFASEGAKTYTLSQTYDRVQIEVDLDLSEAMTLSMTLNGDTGATDYTTTTMDNDSIQTGATAANAPVIVVGAASSFSATYHFSGKISGIRKFVWGQGVTNTTTNAIMIKLVHLKTGNGDLSTFTLTPSAGTLTGTVKVFGITY